MLFVRSMLVLGLRFGLGFAIALAALAYVGASWYWGIAIALGMIFLQYLVSPYMLLWVV